MTFWGDYCMPRANECTCGRWQGHGFYSSSVVPEGSGADHLWSGVRGGTHEPSLGFANRLAIDRNRYPPQDCSMRSSGEGSSYVGALQVPVMKVRARQNGVFIGSHEREIGIGPNGNPSLARRKAEAASRTGSDQRRNLCKR